MATVLHVLERYLDVSSGFVHGQISRSRHRPVVVSIDAPVNEGAFPLPDVRSARWVRSVPAQWRGGAGRRFVLRTARSVDASIAHAHFGYALPYTRVAQRDAAIPVVVSLHGHDATAWARAAPWAYEPAPELVAAVVVPSRWLADAAVALGFSAEQVRVIPAGVDTAYFAPSPLPDGPPTVTFVGRLVEKKGVDVLMHAWPAVRDAVPDARLRVVGDGPLARLVAGSGVERVLPDAARRAEQVRDALRSAHVVATPSHAAADGDSESLLLVNLEAQASGRPVVTTGHGGIPEFVAEGDSALVVPERDAAALADALITVLRDGALAARLGSNGAQVAARYDAAAMAARVDDLYDELLGRRSS